MIKNKIAIINGPNINMLGIREPEIYGTLTLRDIEQKVRDLGVELGVNLQFFQSNHEGNIVDFIQKNIEDIDGVVINPAAFTNVGYSILDALTTIDIPFVEVHLSNIFAREEWHSKTIFASRAIGHINGFQGNVYCLGLRAICDYLKKI